MNSPPDLQKILTHINVFTHMSADDKKMLETSAIARSYKTGEWVTYQGDVWPFLFLVTEGKIDAIKESAEGRSFIATSLKPGDIFWGLAFYIEDAPMPVLLQAKEATQIYMWRRDYLVPIIQQHGAMSWKLCQLMISRMQLASAIVEDLAFQPVMARLAGLILSEFSDAEDEFKSRELTLEEMASRIGTTREMVCRHLYRFAEKGAIQIKRTELRITDRNMLEKQAGK